MITTRTVWAIGSVNFFRRTTCNRDIYTRITTRRSIKTAGYEGFLNLVKNKWVGKNPKGKPTDDLQNKSTRNDSRDSQEANAKNDKTRVPYEVVVNNDQAFQQESGVKDNERVIIRRSEQSQNVVDALDKNSRKIEEKGQQDLSQKHEDEKDWVSKRGYEKYFISPGIERFPKGVHSQVNHIFTLDQNEDKLLQYFELFDKECGKQLEKLKMFLDLLGNNDRIVNMIDYSHIHQYIKHLIRIRANNDIPEDTAIRYAKKLYVHLSNSRIKVKQNVLLDFHTFFSRHCLLADMHHVEKTIMCEKLEKNLFAKLCINASYAYALAGEIEKAFSIISLEEIRYTHAFKLCMLNVIVGLCIGDKASVDEVNYFFKWIYFPRFPIQKKPLLVYAKYLNKHEMHNICLALFQMSMRSNSLTIPLSCEILKAAIALGRLDDVRKAFVLLKDMCKTDEDRDAIVEIYNLYNQIKNPGGPPGDYKSVEDNFYDILIEECGNILINDFNEYIQEWENASGDNEIYKKLSKCHP